MALNGESTLADLARELHISVPTITKLVGELVEENIVVDNGKIETAGGRRPNIFGLANTAIYFAGIDIGRDNVRYVVTDLKNNVIVSEEERDFVLSDNEQSLEEICRRINRFIDGCRIERCKILGMGDVHCGARQSQNGAQLHVLHFESGVAEGYHRTCYGHPGVAGERYAGPLLCRVLHG